MSLSIAARRARLLALRDLIDAGGGGQLQLYGNAMVASPETPAGAAPLAVVDLEAVSFALDDEGLPAMYLFEVVGNASSSGYVTWGRFVDGTGVAVVDAAAGPPGSGAPILVSDGAPVPTAQVYTGGELTINATISEV